MEHILVPTDFSEFAGHALEASIAFSKKFKASLHLYTCVANRENEEEIAIVTKKLTDIQSRFPEVNITFSYSGGKLVEGIQRTIKEQNIDFVIMGSHGTSGWSEIFIGSNTQKIVRLIHRPMLIIKGPVRDLSFKRIVFASNFNDSEKEPFLHFKKIVQGFQPEICLLGIKTSFFFDAPVSATKAAIEKFKKLASPFPCKTYIFKNANISGGIREFAENIDADMIAISNLNRNPLKRIFTGSNVEALINHSNLPVLSIDYEETKPTG